MPQGGNTGLVGGQTPHNGEVVLSLARMDKFREIDPASNTMTCEAGVVLIKAQQAAADVDRLFPLSLGAEGSCTIGGNLSTNAGGTGALAYGVARDLVLGLEVVLADGRVMRGLNKLKKDNTGYDLRHLFLGAEGTLGIITAAVLKLFPRPRAVETAFIGAALAASRARTSQSRSDAHRRRRDQLRADGAVGHRHGDQARHRACAIRCRQKHPWYVLLQLSSQSREGTARDDGSASRRRRRTRACRGRHHRREHRTGEIVLAYPRISARRAEAGRRLDQARRLGAGRRRAGISSRRPMPRSKNSFPAFARCRSATWATATFTTTSASRSAPTRTNFSSRWYEVNAVVHDVVAKLGGSISAEHGIGVIKRDLLPGVKDPVALELMRTLKHTLDPNNILNPGKVI